MYASTNDQWARPALALTLTVTLAVAAFRNGGSPGNGGLTPLQILV